MNNEIIKQLIVSVGIPTYNRPEGLRRTLDFITNQTYTNLEIIISDNCSKNPEVTKVAKEYSQKDSRIKYFRQEKNIGAGNNFKFVLQNASGEYFMWAADDDEWDKEFIATCIGQVKNKESVFTGMFTHFRKTGYINTNIILPELSENNSKYDNVTNFLLYIQPSLIYGIHHRESILYFLNDDFWDFYDCYFVLKQILTNSFIIVNDKKLYTAGVDDNEYIYKPLKPRKGKLFEYKRYLTNSILCIMKAKDLKLKEKIKLIKLFINLISDLFIKYESEYRRFQVKLVKNFKRIFKKI